MDQLVENCWSVSWLWKTFKEEKLNLKFAEDNSVVPSGKTDSEYMTFQWTIVLPFGHVLYPYDCMEKFEKIQRRKTKNLQKKNWSLEKLEKLGKRRNLDFKSGFCTWLATTHNISYSWQSWQCSVLTIINATFIVKKGDYLI